MNFSQIEKYFTSQENMAELLKECQSVFDMIDDYSQQFLQNMITLPQELDEVRTRLAGGVMFLNPIYSTAITFKKNEEMRYFVEKKRDIENRPPVQDEKGKMVKEKFVSGAVEGEASEHVREFRRVRNILEGYINSSWAGIKLCEEKIKETKLERP